MRGSPTPSAWRTSQVSRARVPTAASVADLAKQVRVPEASRPADLAWNARVPYAEGKEDLAARVPYAECKADLARWRCQGPLRHSARRTWHA